MALEDIVNRIGLDALDAAAEVKEDALSRAEEISGEARGRAEAISKQILREARAKAKEDGKRCLVTASLESRKEVLSTKQDLIEDAFQRAQATLAKLADDKYRKLIKKMLLEAVESGDESIIVSTKDRSRISPSFLKEVNRSLTDEGKKVEVKVSRETREIRGGFILSSGRSETNCSFEALIKVHRDDLEPEVAKILFPREI